MSRDKLQLLSPLFLKYQNEYEKNPRSRVFAPLAETYRKLGMTDKAMEILSQGIRFHPTYVMGYLGLAFCYFDIKQYNLAYSTLRPLVESNRDNIRLQKLFADICIELNNKEEALETYKYLLFINPRDREVAAQVTMLENFLENQYKPNHKPIYIPEEELIERKNLDHSESDKIFDIDKLDSGKYAGQKDFDDWMALDLSRESVAQTEKDQYDFWNLKKGPEALISKSEENSPKEPAFRLEVAEDESIFQPSPVVNLDLEEEVQNTPLVTHTLVDLYCGQGHIEKALEVLEKILILNPKDQKTIAKIAEIKQLIGIENDLEIAKPQVLREEDQKQKPKNLYTIEENIVSEEAGRQHLMSLIDETLGSDSGDQEHIVSLKENSKNKEIEQKLLLFLQRIQKRALDYQSRL